MGGWEISFLGGFGLFSGAMLVSARVTEIRVTVKSLGAINATQPTVDG